MRRIILFILLFVLSVICGCFGSPAGPAAEPVVFIHGIKGARLVDAQERVQWLAWLPALGLRVPELALPLAWRGEVQVCDQLRAEGVLAAVPVIPGIYSKDVYGRFMTTASTLLGSSFYPFDYDWRRDNLETLARFEAFVGKLHARTGAPVTIIAHSMGGLIALALINRHPGWIKKAIFAGVPFAGGIGFLPDLTVGTPNGLNRKILAPAVLGSFPSVYSLFPLDGHGALSEKMEPLAVDFFETGLWKEKNWGVFGGPPRADAGGSAEAKERFLAVALAHARSFRALLQPAQPLPRDYPPVRIVAGHAQATLVSVVLGPVGEDFERAPREPGDGRVAVSDARPPAPIPYELIESDQEHSALLNDPRVLAELSPK